MDIDVCKTLTDALDAAREGKVKGVVLLSFNPDGSVNREVAGSVSVIGMLGALRLVEHDVIAELDDRDS